ncbi:MAG: lipid-A-disaccharide synthase [Elusimicrobia bacterium RIFOXYA2_FULL_39_19]|nr:MAG: lipid-A-disaccharide synthase [Elusimicrobia bacterium RIFOXYA2_FULL_39_19]
MDILISAGDPSGDFHASKLALELKKLNKNLKISSIGGKHLRLASDSFIYNIVDLNLHGLWEPIKHSIALKYLIKNRIIPYLKTNNIKAVITVDFYGFNINLAEAAKSLNIPVYYFISPQVWATRPKRVYRLKNAVNHMFVIFPFEKEIYDKAGVPVTFVGNPVLDSIAKVEKKPVRSPETGSFTIGLFPGSRKQVINWNLPIMNKTAERIRIKYPNIEFKIFGMKSLEDCYKQHSDIKVVFDENNETRKKIDMAITTSGTVALENTLLEIPMIVMYHLPWLTYIIIKIMINVKNVTITNLLAGREIIPEYIQDKADPELIAGKTLDYLANISKLEDMKSEFRHIRNILGNPGCYERTARLIMEKTK